MEQFFKRGDIRNEGFVKQINSFSGLLRRRGITPTDIDGLIDYNGKAFVILEGKFGNTTLPMGQKMALENLANAIQEGGRKVILMVFRHNVPIEQAIDVSSQNVSDYYFNYKWQKPCEEINVLEAVIKFEQFCENKDIVI
jgi:hypothetical protein